MKSKRPAFRPLGEVLGADTALGQWSQRREREAELTRLVRHYLPRALGERLRVRGIEDGALIVAVSAGAIASALRARGPDLLAALRHAGCDVAALRIRVHVETPAVPTPVAAPRALDTGAAAPLFDLAAQLAEGPLKRSLARWSRRARGH